MIVSKIILFSVFLQFSSIENSFKKELLKTYITDSTGFIYPGYWVYVQSAQGFIHHIEITDEEGLKQEKINETIKENLHKTVKDSILKTATKEGYGIIPDIDIPIPVPSIFGIGEGANIKITGSQDITFGGIKDLYSDPTNVESRSALPELEMKQHLIVKTAGTIGRKIKINLDHDSERETQEKNTVLLQYVGDEDEIVQMIEAGNTSFNFGGSQGSGGKGLFGVRGVFQTGPLTFESILSREQGDVKTIEIRPGKTWGEDTIIDYNYVQGKFFLLPVPPGDTVTTLYVFYDNGKKSDDATEVPQPKYAKGFYYPDSAISDSGTFRQLSEGTDWIRASYLGNVIQLLNIQIPYNGNQQLGVYYITSGGDTVGNITGDTLELLIIRERQLNSYEDPTWKYEMRNVYYIGEFVPDTSYIKIVKLTNNGWVETQNGIPYLKILGLDENNDGKIDLTLTNGFNPIQGSYLIFPQLEPFIDTSLQEPDSSVYMYSEPYNYDNSVGKYGIVVSSRKKPSEFTLFGIIEKSERIYMNGRELTRGVDYEIDYETGYLKILNSQYLTNPDLPLEIKYEQASIFQLKQKSLLGLRGEYNMGTWLKLSNTWLMRTESSLDRRPKLNEEPQRAIQGTYGLSINLQPDFLTVLADKLPIVQAEKPSELKIETNISQSFPNPNIYGDAYVDDMESSETSYDLPLTYSNWSVGSPPDTTFKPEEVCKRLVWVTKNNEVQKREINENLPEEEGNNYATVMKLKYKSLNLNPDEWGSIITLLSEGGIDFSKYEFLEIRVKGNKGIFGIDIGQQLYEDAFWRDKNNNLKGKEEEIDTEDKATTDREINGLLDPGEDTGLDGVAGKDNENVSGDDGNDDLDINNEDKINGTELNSKFDTEDLDDDGFVTLPDRIFRFKIDLANDTPDYQSASGYKLFRIPLQDTLKYEKIGKPNWKKIRYARLWLTGLSQDETIYIAEIKLTGNRYLKDTIGTLDSSIPVDSSEFFGITTYNNKDDINYTPPPIPLYRDPTTNREERESSLVLKFKNFGPQHYASATRTLYGYTDDLLKNYRELKFYVRGVSDSLMNGELPIFFIRLATGSNSSSHFYEYRTAVQEGKWKEHKIDLLKFIEVKRKREKSGFPEDSLFIDPDDARFAIKGNPNLKSIKFYTVGIINLSSSATGGEIWVDELRVGKPVTTTALKISSKADLRISDLIGLNLNYDEAQADFRDLNFNYLAESRKSLGFTGSLSLHKFIPVQGLSLPLTYSLTKGLSYPKYAPQSDAILTHEQAIQNKTDSRSESMTGMISKTNSENPILKYTIDKMRLTASRNLTSTIAPLNIDSTNSLNAQVSYDIPLPIKPIKFLGQQISFLPSNLSSSFSYANNVEKRWTRANTDTIFTRTLSSKNIFGTAKYSVNYSPLSTIQTNYTLESEYNLRANRWTKKWWGIEDARNQNFNFSYRPTLPLFFKTIISSPNFEFSGNYRENKNTRNRPGDPRELSKNISNSGNFTFSSSMDILSPIETFLKWANENVGRDFSKIKRILTPFQITLSRNTTTNFFNIYKRPSWEYQFGLKSNIPLDSLSIVGGNNQKSDQKTGNISTRVNIGIFSFQVQAQKTFRVVYNLNDETKTTSNEVEFPSVRGTISNLQSKIPVFKNYLSSLTLEYGYTKRKGTTESFDANGEVTSTSLQENYNYSPLFSFQGRLRNGVGFSLGSNYSKGKTTTLTTVSSNESYNISKGINGSFDFSIISRKGFVMPFFKKRILELKSELNANIRASLTENKQFSGINTITSHTVQKQLTVDMSYNFSRDITGKASIEYTKNENKQTQFSTGNFGLFFGVSFKF